VSKDHTDHRGSGVLPFSLDGSLGQPGLDDRTDHRGSGVLPFSLDGSLGQPGAEAQAVGESFRFDGGREPSPFGAVEFFLPDDPPDKPASSPGWCRPEPARPRDARPEPARPQDGPRYARPQGGQPSSPGWDQPGPCPAAVRCAAWRCGAVRCRAVRWAAACRDAARLAGVGLPRLVGPGCGAG